MKPAQPWHYEAREGRRCLIKALDALESHPEQAYGFALIAGLHLSRIPRGPETVIEIIKGIQQERERVRAIGGEKP